MNPRILVIDDSPELHSLIRVRLAREAVSVHCALDAATGVAEARKGNVDMILLDVDMPDRDGFSVCAELKSHPETKDIPIVFLSGAASTSDKIRGLDLGAADYIAKPFDAAELRARVRATLRARDLMVLLAKKAMIDGLTGLWNRRYLDAQMMVELASSRRTGEPLACIMADIDHFKLINDKCGHGFGDDVLRKIASVLSENCRARDVLCRYGGEEFAILLPDTTPADAVDVAERLRQAVEQISFQYFERPVPVTCSFGVAYLRDRVPPTVLELADEALYNAKHFGRNRVVRWEEPAFERECCIA